MLKRILLRFQDIKTLGKLIPGAEQQAQTMGEEKPGAEHFVLSALDLEDGTAKRVFDRFGINANQFKAAVKTQYDEALHTLGIHAPDLEPEPIRSDKILLDSSPSGQSLMQSLYQLASKHKAIPLQSAHVIAVAADIDNGVVPRAFKVLGIDRTALAKAAREEIVVSA